jgi:deoxyribodipyrimidine photo-lyase
LRAISAQRIEAVNAAGVRADGSYVLYWMIAQRRTRWSFALDRAVDLARDLGKGLLIFEPLRCGYRWASDRLHQWVIDGMADNARALAGAPATYYAYLEPAPGEGSGLLESLAEHACCVVTDDYPCFFLPSMVAAAGRRLPVRLEQVDGNGLLPMRAADKAYGRAVDFRRFLQRELPGHLGDLPRAEPFAGVELPRLEVSPSILARWPDAAPALVAGERVDLGRFPIDHGVAPIRQRGGSVAGQAALRTFLDQRLTRYLEGRMDLDRRAASELSPYLHFGHVGSHQVFWSLCEHERWTSARLVGGSRGAKEGYWGLSADAEAFVDQLVTWRELGFNACRHVPGYDRYDSLPAWCQTTLAKHESDERPWRYSLEELENARTHDEVWNAAQRELRVDGRIHNYLRMLWGKKILEWSATPREALAIAIHLNDQYAVDGRDPNSYSGILWCFGRYDRPWAPERPIFGLIRYMSSDNTRRKLDLKRYLATYGPLSLA